MDITLFSHAVVEPLTQILFDSSARIIGISGSAGAGKTTLANLLQANLAKRDLSVLCISLDDFCFGRDERFRRQIRWRAAPGSHDTTLLDHCLSSLASRRSPIELPVYDKAVDDRKPNRLLDLVPDVVVMDGWFIGSPVPDYKHSWRHIDLHIHLDVPIQLAKQRRFQREERLRKEGGGLPLAEMNAFWSDVLEPVSLGEVQDARSHAHVVVSAGGMSEGALRYTLAVNFP